MCGIESESGGWESGVGWVFEFGLAVFDDSFVEVLGICGSEFSDVGLEFPSLYADACTVESRSAGSFACGGD